MEDTALHSLSPTSIQTTFTSPSSVVRRAHTSVSPVSDVDSDHVKSQSNRFLIDPGMGLSTMSGILCRFLCATGMWLSLFSI